MVKSKAKVTEIYQKQSQLTQLLTNSIFVYSFFVVVYFDVRIAEAQYLSTIIKTAYAFIFFPVENR